MIVLSPEIVFIIQEYRQGTDTIEFSSKFLERTDKRFFYRRLIKNLRFLEALKVIKIEYISNRKIQIRILDRGVLDFIRGLVEELGYNIDFELNFRALKILNYMHVSPYIRDIRFFAALFGITTKGVKKAINKLQKLRLIDEKLNVTDRGAKLLSYVCRNENLCRMIRSRINPFLSLRLVETPISGEIIDSIYDMITSIIDLNRCLGVEINGVVLFAFESDARVMNILKGLSRRMTINHVVVPVLVSEERLCRILTFFGQRYYGILAGKNRNMIGDLDFCEIGLLLEFLEKTVSSSMDMVSIVFSPPIIAYIIDEYIRSLKKERINLILLPTIDREFINVSPDVSKVYEYATRILPKLMGTITEGGEILVRWNIDSDEPSEIRIKSPGMDEQSLKSAIRIEDGKFRDRPLYVPLGEVRVDLCELARHGVKIGGQVSIIGEPIVGLKLPDEEWVRGGYCKREATLTVTIENSEKLPTVSKVDTDIEWLKCLQDALICQLHIGLNEAREKSKYELISPIITRTKNFIHFWIVDRQNETYYQLIVRNAEIEVNSRVIWRTTRT